MEETTISLIISSIAVLLAVFAIVFTGKQPVPQTNENFNTIPLQLQAYERLVMLCERIAIPNLISRTSQFDLSAKEMQVVLIENIKQEFDYNTSQQIYVTALAWDAIRNLKDQSMLIINQVAGLLPAEAKASDLNKKLLELMINHQDQSLHTIVADTLNFEAKKLMSSK
ncbi:MAG TPA: hypothetical protein VNA26_02070 [Chitinophagaceae bacterium]|nr:hypothetical protein [Chitinophagaceae bacterium]